MPSNSNNANLRAAATRDNIAKDFDNGRTISNKILPRGGEGLGRLRDQQEVKDVEEQLKAQAQLSDAEKAAQRESGLRQLQGSQQGAQRNLSSTLARSGVKGGAAGQAQVELAAQGLQSRRDLERDLFLQQSQLERQGTAALANFQLNTSQFDLAQVALSLIHI